MHFVSVEVLRLTQFKACQRFNGFRIDFKVKDCLLAFNNSQDRIVCRATAHRTIILLHNDVIKKDRSNILLRYLYQQLDKKNKSDDASKRKAAEGSLTNEISTSDDEPRRKFARCSNSAPSSNTDDTVESAMENR
ncbi:uncharacterized protein LOC143461752 isoform X1 [Clavelina lepadiformis]|uniref:uncharacterized protein LOC143461752 isoform X1 n=1 Tax=Clavelina lepadiformis TaxID=159417 RepID=UPI0040416714